mgnify:CR=1 FL=1
MKTNIYSVEFDDGILIGIKYKEGMSNGDYTGYMCSLGESSYFMNKGNFPKDHNLKNRLIMGTDIIKSRMKRYKRRVDIKESK